MERSLIKSSAFFSLQFFLQNYNFVILQHQLYCKIKCLLKLVIKNSIDSSVKQNSSERVCPSSFLYLDLVVEVTCPDEKEEMVAALRRRQHQQHLFSRHSYQKLKIEKRCNNFFVYKIKIILLLFCCIVLTLKIYFLWFAFHKYQDKNFRHFPLSSQTRNRKNVKQLLHQMQTFKS